MNISDKVPVFISPLKSYSEEQNTSSSGRNVMSDSSIGLKQQTSELTTKDDISRFLIPDGTILFHSDRKDKLYKAPSWSTTSSGPRRSNFRGVQTEMSGCARNQFGRIHNLLNSCQREKIPKNLSARIDELVQSATLVSGSPGSSDNSRELLDLKTICSKIISTIRYIPVKFRMQWSGIITSTMEDCISHLDCVDNWKKYFAVSRCLLRASNSGVQKHKQQQENSMVNRLERWRSCEYAALWYKAASSRPAKN